MLFGKWKIHAIEENGHQVIEQYFSSNSRYLILEEDGSYRLGLIDTSNDKNWIAEAEQNQLILLDDELIENIKIWDVVAADSQLKLSNKERALTITLNRVQALPQASYKQEEDLIGKWTVDKVTINGTNSTSNYAYPDRWIILAKNGMFYNGETIGNQNTGYWKANEELTRLQFRLSEDTKSPALEFTIAENFIWYEKEKEEGKKHIVRIYFKKDKS
jgi:hypothetical protein